MIRHKKAFGIGAFLAMSFIGVLVLIFSPLYGGQNGLQYADMSFNRLAKGSSYFIPKVIKVAQKYEGQQVLANIQLESESETQAALKILPLAGMTAENADEGRIKVQGDMGLMLQNVIKDSDAMYNNDGQAVSSKYGVDEKEAMKTWWGVLSKLEKEFKKEKKIEEAKAVSDVNKKAVEPSYNFYHVEAQKVSEHAGMLSGLLVFYVAYTMWWGFAIFFLFEGLGLSMTKAKHKKEV
jgi:hypothetical protein